MKNFFERLSPSYTFEIFPPKGNASTAGTYAVIDSLVSFNPDLISVTYGAGGSSRDNTVEITSGIQNKYKVCGVAHLTCVGTTRTELRDILNRLKNNNVRNILALRGDLKDESDLGEFHHASELIKFIKDEFGDEFDIFAACYPEKHPEAKSLEEDLARLKEKCDLGVKALISQLFFDNDVFWEWREKARSIGITQPIIAGVMPITSSSQISKVVEMCGASMPVQVRRFVNAYGNNQAAIKEAGIAYAVEQIIDLLARDVDGIHLYTMNQADTVRRIDLGIRSVLYTRRYEHDSGE